mgnify:CR=1 FL=1
MSEEADDSALEARIEAHCADFEALLDERITAPDGLAELLVVAARALINRCEAPVYIVPISATCYALAVRGREVVTVTICGPALYEVAAVDRRGVTVSEGGLKKALGDAILAALPVFVHAAVAGGPEAS